jgi:hypothetical protein
MVTDEDGALYLETLNCRIGLEGDRVWLEDSTTGENLLTNLQAQRALGEEKVARQAAEARAAAEEEARQAAEAQAKAEAAARQAAEARIAELEAKVRLLEQQT